MTDRAVDPERPREPNAFDRPAGYSGQEYHRDREADEGARAADPSAPVPDGDPDLPAHNGARASVDPVTGAVSGAGMLRSTNNCFRYLPPRSNTWMR